jgi:hypothetical protein
VLAGLPAAARTRWEAFMSTTIGYKYEFRSELALQAKAEGKAEGEAHSVLTVLEARGVAVPDDVRDRILACTDLAQLDTWLRRSITAATIDEVVHG